MKAIVLAAGKGSRLGEFTKGKPKCLLPIGDETIISREIRLLEEAGIRKDNIFVVGGYRADLLEAVSPNLIINEEYDRKDNSYSLGCALTRVYDDDVIIIDGDLCFEKELLLELMEDEHANVLLSKKSGDLEESTGIVVQGDGRVKAIGKQYRNTGYVYISIFKITVDTIPALRAALLSEKAEKTWYPLAITDICEKYPFYNKVSVEKWHEIDFVEDYKAALEMFDTEGEA